MPPLEGMLNGLGSAAAGSNGTLGGHEPGVHVGQGRYGMLLAQRVALQRGHAYRLLFNAVQLRNTTQCLFRHGTAAGDVDVEELAPDVGQASELGGASRKQRLVAREMLCTTFRRLCCAEIYVEAAGSSQYFAIGC